jgi:hypothetical protein
VAGLAVIIEALDIVKPDLCSLLRSMVQDVAASTMEERLQSLCDAIRSESQHSSASPIPPPPPFNPSHTNDLTSTIYMLEAMDKLSRYQALERDAQEAARLAAELEEQDMRARHEQETQDALDAAEAARLAEELDAQDRMEQELAESADISEAVRLSAELQASEAMERHKREHFYCEICLMEEPVHGSYALDCGHRVCEDQLSGFICSKIHSNEVINLTSSSISSPIMRLSLADKYILN